MRPTRQTPQPSLAGRQNLLISAQLDKQKTLTKQRNLTILTYFKTVRTHNATNSTKSTNCHALGQTNTSHLDATPYQVGKLNNAHFL